VCVSAQKLLAGAILNRFCAVFMRARKKRLACFLKRNL